tara:strand:+ start:22964 stop:24067 length:1104 start_codon:yes stop_codon:yes gene_type:complete
MIDRSKYREYKLVQTRIQGKLDSEFEFFDTIVGVGTDISTDEFISDVKLSGDFHDALINNEVQIALKSGNIEPILIPDYKTLEVMLVERGLTYNAIRIQTNIDEFIYDDLNELASRLSEYNNVIRFESGYKPAFPFFRDPGDYIDGNDYDEQVYQKQTYLEKLRAQYEGEMIVLNDFNADIIVESVRMMIYGEWRSIAYATTQNGRPFPESTTLEYYNHINGLGLDYDATADWYDDNSILNVMIDEGVITNLQDDGLSSPVWNDFNHYEYDEGGRRGISNTDYVQVARYQRYINTTNNEVFDLEYMQPYEPEGSELYYDEYAGWNDLVSNNSSQQSEPNVRRSVLIDRNNLPERVVSQVRNVRRLGR